MLNRRPLRSKCSRKHIYYSSLPQLHYSLPLRCLQHRLWASSRMLSCCMSTAYVVRESLPNVRASRVWTMTWHLIIALSTWLFCFQLSDANGETTSIGFSTEQWKCLVSTCLKRVFTETDGLQAALQHTESISCDASFVMALWCVLRNLSKWRRSC